MLAGEFQAEQGRVTTAEIRRPVKKWAVLRKAYHFCCTHPDGRTGSCASGDAAVRLWASQWHHHIRCNARQATWEQMEGPCALTVGRQPDHALQVGPSREWGHSRWSPGGTQRTSSSLVREQNWAAELGVVCPRRATPCPVGRPA